MRRDRGSCSKNKKDWPPSKRGWKRSESGPEWSKRSKRRRRRTGSRGSSRKRS